MQRGGGLRPGFEVLEVVVESIEENNIALVRDSFGRPMKVRADVRRGNGPLPRVGEIWILDQVLGTWTFSACRSSKPPQIWGATGGSPAMEALLESLDTAGLIENKTNSTDLPPGTEKVIVSVTDEYVVSASETTPPPAGAAWSPETPDWEPGQYVWRRTKTTHLDGTTSYSAPALLTGNEGAPGEDAVLLRVTSTRGTAFKNNTISTVLTATVFKGSRQITNITDLRAEFGSGAYLEWMWRRLYDTDFGVISSSDSRLSQSGFALTVSPNDVDEQTVFQCILHT